MSDVKSTQSNRGDPFSGVAERAVEHVSPWFLRLPRSRPSGGPDSRHHNPFKKVSSQHLEGPFHEPDRDRQSTQRGYAASTFINVLQGDPVSPIFGLGMVSRGGQCLENRSTSKVLWAMSSFG